jgi:hypothetical protein
VARAVGIWLTLVVVESIHGVTRRLLLEPRLADLRARQVSVFTGAALLTLAFWFTLKWLGPPCWSSSSPRLGETPGLAQQGRQG